MKRSTSIIIALICCFLWALVFPVLKLLYIELNMVNDSAKLTLAGMRFLLAGLIVLIYFIIANKSFPKINSMKLLGELSVLGLFQTTLVYAFFFIGASNATGIKSSVLSQSSIFFVAFLAHYTLKGEALNYKKTLALLLGVIGMIVININKLGSMNELWNFAVIGEGYLIISGLFNAIGTIIAKKMSKNNDAVLMNGWQLTIGGVFLLTLGIITHGQLITFPNSYSIFLFLILVFISAIAFTLWFIILKYVKASQVTIFKFTIPIIGAISSAILVPGEVLSIYNFLGLAFVSYGIYYCNK